MTITSLYPALMTRDVASAAAFYRDIFGFETVFEADWYASLKLGAFEIALLAHNHATVPRDYRVLPQGIIVNVEVDDANEMHARLVKGLGLPTVLSLRDEEFGQRHFIVAGPDDVLIDIIQPIEPSAAFAEAYVESHGSTSSPPTPQ